MIQQKLVYDITKGPGEMDLMVALFRPSYSTVAEDNRVDFLINQIGEIRLSITRLEQHPGKEGWMYFKAHSAEMGFWAWGVFSLKTRKGKILFKSGWPEDEDTIKIGSWSP